MATIEKGSLVLITGASGFIASHTVLTFLEAGYRVRGTVRDQKKVEWLHEHVEKKFGKGKFETVVVPDMITDGAFDEAVKGVDGIVHMASVLNFSEDPDEVIPPTVKGTLNILVSATKEPGIKSVVLTSSSTSALSPKPNEVIKVSHDTWNDEAVRKAREPGPDGFTVYSASKTEGERAFWKAIKDSKPPFQAAAVLPNANFGPILKPGGEDSASTASWITGLFKGNTDMVQFPPQYFIDVRDDAKLHLIALIDPSCNGQRLFGFAEPYNWQDIIAIFKKQNPGKTFPEDIPDLGKDLSQIPSQDAEALLRKHYGKGWTSLEESVAANTATLK